MRLNNIAFPVYKLGKELPSKDGGLLYYAKTTENGITISYVDNKDLPENTLGKRRLMIMLEGHKLYKLTNAIFFLGDFIKIAKKDIWFIDSLGKVFEYKKSVMVPLSFHKIEQITEILGGCLVKLQGLPATFKTLFKPTKEELYAGVLKIGTNNFILYGYSTVQYKTTVRKI